MKHIYVSPHSDDVALSCGGQIIANAAAKDDILVLNIFTSETEEQEKSETRLFDSINSERTSEDKSAWDSIGIKAAYANLPEALLRKVFPFHIVHRAKDENILGTLEHAITEYIDSYPDATFYFPAGFGNHVDHLACRKAAFRLLDEGRLNRILFYEDVPYSWLRFIRNQSYKTLLRRVHLERDSYVMAFRKGGEDFLDYIRGTTVPFPRGKKLFALVYSSLMLTNMVGKMFKHRRKYNGRLQIVRLSNEQVSKKKDLLYHYRSQIPMLFGNDPEHLLRDLNDIFAREVTIEVTKRSSSA